MTRSAFEVDSLDAQIVADALAHRRPALGGDVDVVDVFVDLCRSALTLDAVGRATSGSSTESSGPPSSADGAPDLAERSQVVLQKCPACEVVVHVGYGAVAHAVTPAAAAQAACDAAIVDMDRGCRVTRAIPSKVCRRVAHRDGHMCVVPGRGARLWLDVHHLNPRASGGGHDERNLVLSRASHHRRVREGTLTIWRQDDGTVAFRRGPAQGQSGAVSADSSQRSVSRDVVQAID